MTITEKEHAKILGRVIEKWRGYVKDRDAELSLLKAKLEEEHENFLGVHRLNMRLSDRNMELKKKVKRLKEALQPFANLGIYHTRRGKDRKICDNCGLNWPCDWAEAKEALEDK